MDYINHTWRTVITVSVVYLLLDEGACDEASLFKHIKDTLVPYPQVRPRKNPMEAVDVKIELELIKILSVDEKSQVMTSVGFFVAEWYDDHVMWKPSTFGGQETIVIPPSTVWLPDFGLANSASTFYKTTFTRDFRLRAHYTGRMVWSFGGEVSTICTLDMTFYPFDLQNCSLQVENWAYTLKEVTLRNNKSVVEVDSYETNGVWRLVETRAEHRNRTYETMGGDAQYPEVCFILFIERKAMFYLVNLLLPCALIIIVALAVFWLPADSGEKVSLGVTVLLAFSVFQLVIADQTPVNSDYTPILARMVISIMSLSSVSVLTSIWVLYLHHKDATRVVPHCVKIFAFRGMATILCMRASVPQLAPREKVAPKLNGDHVNEDDGRRAYLPCQGHGIPDLAGISDNLAYITDKMKEKEEEDIIMAEWKAVAKILDRFLFWISSFVIIFIFVLLITSQDTDH